MVNKEFFKKYFVDKEDVIKNVQNSYINIYGLQYEEIINKRLNDFILLNYITYEDVLLYINTIKIYYKNNLSLFEKLYKEEINYIDKCKKLFVTNTLNILEEFKNCISEFLNEEELYFLNDVISYYENNNDKLISFMTKKINLVEMLELEFINDYELTDYIAHYEELIVKYYLINTSNIIEENKKVFNESEDKVWKRFYLAEYCNEVCQIGFNSNQIKKVNDNVTVKKTISLYTLYLYTTKILEDTIFHELVHQINRDSSVKNEVIYIKSGLNYFEFNTLTKETIKEYNMTLLDEIITQIISILVKEDYYKINNKLCNIDNNKIYDIDSSVAKITYDKFIFLIEDFFKKYFNEIIESSISNDLTILDNIISFDNLYKLNNILEEYSNNIDASDEVRFKLVDEIIGIQFNNNDYSRIKNIK